jgi:solute carrier family 35 protein E1
MYHLRPKSIMKLLSVLLLIPSAFVCNAFVPQRASHININRVDVCNARNQVILAAPKNRRTTPRTSLRITDGLGVPETALHRMRRRKVAIYQKKKTYATGYLFALWYVFSVAYNIFSKNTLNMAPALAWTTATLQMSLGLTYVFPLWKFGVRDQPKLSFNDITRLLPVAILHSLVHIGGVVSMGAGAVSFTYIVKASEPAVSALLAALTGSILPPSVYLTILPVMGGVALASVSELSFTWKSFNYAMLSNIASAGRGIVGKKAINKRLGQSMTANNLYAVLTMMATFFLIPVTIAMEGSILRPAFEGLRASQQLSSYIIQTFLASLFYYLYNEMAFLCLDNVSPVSHALGNTLKRVFIILSSMVVFGNRMTLRGAIGSVTAIGGVFLYSVEKTRQSKIAKEKKQNK